jgi:hypothetical protein
MVQYFPIQAHPKPVSFQDPIVIIPPYPRDIRNRRACLAGLRHDVLHITASGPPSFRGHRITRS